MESTNSTERSPFEIAAAAFAHIVTRDVLDGAAFYAIAISNAGDIDIHAKGANAAHNIALALQIHAYRAKPIGDSVTHEWAGDYRTVPTRVWGNGELTEHGAPDPVERTDDAAALAALAAEAVAS